MATKRRSSRHRSIKRRPTKRRSIKRSRTLSKLKRYGSKARSMAMRNKYRLLGGAAGLAGTYAAHRYMQKPFTVKGKITGYGLVKAGVSGGLNTLKGKAYSTKYRIKNLIDRISGNKT